MTLAWSASTDNVAVTGYIVSRNGTEIQTTPNTSITDTGLNSSTAYQYAVKATDEAGNVSGAATLSVTTLSGTADTTAPTTPGPIIFSSVTSSAMTLTWTAATDNIGVTGYVVSRNGTALATITGTTLTDTGLTAATSYTYSVVAVDAAGNTSTARTGTMATTSTGTNTSGAVRVNAGGASYVDSTGATWTADNGYNTGTTYTNTATVTGTTVPTLFKTERYQNATDPALSYTFSVPNGNYLVRLYFAETYSTAMGTGKRVFDVNVQSTLTFDNVDIFALAGGGNKALVLEKATAATNGQIKVDFIRGVSNPKINAIEILPVTTTADTQAPTSPGMLSFSGVSSNAVTISWPAATDNVGVTGYKISRGGTVLSTVSGLSYADTGLSPSTSYTYSVIAVDAAGNASTARTGTIATTAGGTSTSTIRVNAGGSAYVDSGGKTWSADQSYTGGASTTSTATVAGTTDPTLYKTERYQASATAPLSYTFAIPNGDYLVRLYFAETYTGTQAVGKRVFDVDIQSARAFEDVDIYAQAGANKALVLQSAAKVSNGQLKIGFVAQVQNPKINAIEIVPTTIVRVNAGGPSYLDTNGGTWSADKGYNGGKTYSTATTVAGTSDPTLFKTERYQAATDPQLVYTLPVPNGNYLVKLYFAETYSTTKAIGKRVFDIDVQSARAFEDVDIFAQAGGGDKALVLQKATTVTNGQVTVGLVRQVENPKINAIEIIATP